MKALFALLSMIAMIALSGCNTMEGAGKDIERGGEKLQDSARDVKRGM